MNVDPEAFKAPQISPYIYSFNNPINFVDPNGAWPWPFLIRSFAPWSSFGAVNQYEGDKRGYSTSRSATARVNSQFTFDPEKGQIGSRRTWSNSSAWNIDTGNIREKYRDTAHPTGTTTISSASKDQYGMTNYILDNVYAGSLPLHPGFDIDVNTRFNISDDNKGTLYLNVNQSGDNFPTAETLIYDSSGQGLIIGVAPAVGKYPEVNVGGDGNAQMMSSTMWIHYNDKREFTGVTVLGNSSTTNYTPTEWNNKMKSSPVQQTKYINVNKWLDKIKQVIP
ncbi:hypothetical protein CRH01_22840 [Chryseobacterium rhizosphaerae]|nr:hypothetical protein CRH01_22840 [Chryseobacterium rhizosphaerae]